MPECWSNTNITWCKMHSARGRSACTWGELEDTDPSVQALVAEITWRRISRVWSAMDVDKVYV